MGEVVHLKSCKKHGLSKGIATSGRVRCSKCIYEAVKRQRRSLKAKAVEYKGGECIRCGYDRCLDALEFHHRDPSQKDFQIGKMHGWVRIKEELDKCDLLCANCHREEHANIRMSNAA